MKTSIFHSTMLTVLAMLTITILSVSLTSCSDYDDNSSFGTCGLNGVKKSIKSAGIFYSEGKGYNIVVSDTKQDFSMDTKPKGWYMTVDIPIEMLNQTWDMSKNLNGKYWIFCCSTEGKFGGLFISGTITVAENDNLWDIEMDGVNIEKENWLLSYHGIPQIVDGYIWFYSEDNDLKIPANNL